MSNHKRSMAVAAAALACAAALAAAVSLAQDPLPPKGEPMRGSWGFSASGTIVPPAVPAATPAAAVGVMTFQPTGNCDIEDTINVGGTSLSRAASSCTYTLANGRGSIYVTFPGDPGPVPLSFVLADHDRENAIHPYGPGRRDGCGEGAIGLPHRGHSLRPASCFPLLEAGAACYC